MEPPLSCMLLQRDDDLIKEPASADAAAIMPDLEPLELTEIGELELKVVGHRSLKLVSVLAHPLPMDLCKLLQLQQTAATKS